MNKYFVTWEELFKICDNLVKEIKTSIDNFYGQEKHVYKISGYSKNDLILASIFMSKCKYSFFDFEIEYIPENADVIITDIIYFEDDYPPVDKPCFSIFNYIENPEEIKKGFPVFPWEVSDLY